MISDNDIVIHFEKQNDEKLEYIIKINIPGKIINIEKYKYEKIEDIFKEMFSKDYSFIFLDNGLSHKNMIYIKCQINNEYYRLEPLKRGRFTIVKSLII